MVMLDLLYCSYWGGPEDGVTCEFLNLQCVRLI